MSINGKDIASVLGSVTKEWTKQRKAEERRNRAVSARDYLY